VMQCTQRRPPYSDAVQSLQSLTVMQ
jgi:hypothetical protein